MGDVVNITRRLVFSAGRLLQKRPIRIGPHGVLEVFPLLVVSGCSPEAEARRFVQSLQIPLDEAFAAPLLHAGTAVGITNGAGVASVPDSKRVHPLSCRGVHDPGSHVVSPLVALGEHNPLSGRLLDFSILA